MRVCAMVWCDVMWCAPPSTCSATHKHADPDVASNLNSAKSLIDIGIPLKVSLHQLCISHLLQTACVLLLKCFILLIHIISDCLLFMMCYAWKRRRSSVTYGLEEKAFGVAVVRRMNPLFGQLSAFDENASGHDIAVIVFWNRWDRER